MHLFELKRSEHERCSSKPKVQFNQTNHRLTADTQTKTHIWKEWVVILPLIVRCIMNWWWLWVDCCGFAVFVVVIIAVNTVRTQYKQTLCFLILRRKRWVDDVLLRFTTNFPYNTPFGCICCDSTDSIKTQNKFSFGIEPASAWWKEMKMGARQRQRNTLIESVHIKGMLNYGTGISIRAWNMESMRLSRHTNNPNGANSVHSSLPSHSLVCMATKQKKYVLTMSTHHRHMWDYIR